VPGYCGARDIPTLQETGRFVRITASGMGESSAQCYLHKEIIQDNSLNSFKKLSTFPIKRNVLKFCFLIIS
jgi:hypothetical protein